MRISTRILILGVITATLTLGCKKAADLSKVKVLKKPRINLEELDKKENAALLEELKEKNPFQPEHLTSLGNERKTVTQLKGILWDSRNPVAIIGENVVKEGDTFDGKKVIKINPDSVILEEQGEQVTLELETAGQ